MTDWVLYCFEDEDVEYVAANMAENQVRRVPVLTREKRLCGIVALGDTKSTERLQHAPGAPSETPLWKKSDPSGVGATATL